VARNGVIGRENALPWHLPADLRRFQALTMGHSVILGRKTFQGIGRVLPGRRWIVLTRDSGWRHPGVDVAHDLGHALRDLADEEEVFVAGGAEVYAQALLLADRLYLTLVDAEVAGDARFPAWDPAEWRLLADESHPADGRHPYPYRFLRYERVRRRAENRSRAG
jgi:dihydrofolate reductase